MDSLVQTPRRNDQAVGDRMRVHHQRFEELSNEIQITKAFESAGFMKRVSIRMYYKTIHDVNDGFGGKSGACREHTLLREDPDSEVIAWIGGHRRIGPVLQVKKNVALINTASTPGLSKPEAQTAIWRSYIMIQITLQKVVN